ncbi:MAG: VWA domain-containing protein, partial [Planctomycetaceae bacterium]|nr:VWA domain-containing protein [Planctomycetaceae bacterium]
MNPGTSLSSEQAFRINDGIVSAALLLSLLTVVIVDRANLPTGADIVFLIDQRPVMMSMRTAISDRCREIARSLHAQGLDCQFAVIPFGGRRSHLARVALTADMESFEGLLAESPPEGPPENQTAVQALERALSLQFRESTPVLFYLISHTPFTDHAEIKDLTQQMQERRIITLVQADADARDRCQPLLDGGGRFYSFDGEDLTGATNRSNASARTASLVAKLSSQSGVEIAVDSLYGDRTSAKRQEILTRNGGSQESESAARAGLDWLARHQADDGHWSDHDKCEQDACP